MKIIKHGTTIRFVCSNCDCEYEVGINSVRTHDGGENYYCTCPCCGAENHADVKDKCGANVKRYDM